MAGFSKWLAGGLGWAFFGPVGGILGFVLGSMIDSAKVQIVKGGRTTSADFALSLLVLVASIMKADGKVLKSELDYVKKFFVQNFGEEKAREALLILRDLLEKDINIDEVAIQIGQNLNYSSRLQMLHFLYGVANSDGSVIKVEMEIIERIARNMGISAKDSESIKSMFYNDIASLYKVLEIEPSASNDEIKKAYRRMAMKYHPDKVSQLGEDVQKAAKEKFQTLTQAYEKIKKERNMEN
jgi:DnaJ like chaperone protein